MKLSLAKLSLLNVGGAGVSDHGALTGLADDDHPQYSLAALNITGLTSGGVITINADTTKIDISACVYYIQGTKYSYAGVTALDPSFTAGKTHKRIGLDSSGLVTQDTEFTNAQKQTIIPLGLCTSATSGPGSVVHQLRDDRFFISEEGYLQRIWQEEAIGALYYKGGLISESATALQLDQSGGVLYDGQRKRHTLLVDTNIAATKVYHVGGAWTVSAEIDPFIVDNLQYDDGTDLATLGNNKWASHTLLKSPKAGGHYFFVYSQAQYDTEAEALEAGINFGIFIDQGASGLVAIAQIVIQKSAANINNIIDARPRISDGVGGSIGITDHGVLIGLGDDDHPQYAFKAQSVNQAAHGFVVGTPIYPSGVDTYSAAKGDVLDTAGMLTVSEVIDADNFKYMRAGNLTLTTGEWDTITGETGGLLFGQEYAVSNVTAGKLVKDFSTYPIVTVMIIGLSTTEALVVPAITQISEVAFSAHKNGVYQTGVVTGVQTKITWPNENYDTNNDFASDRFTCSQAGKYHFEAIALMLSIDTDVSLRVSIYKNGVAFLHGVSVFTPGAGNLTCDISCEMDLGVGDYVEAFIQHNSAASRDIYGVETFTKFSGHLIK